MAILSKPIPALYTVYILRSAVRHASLYIGSTPHPPRRLKQHNGEARGGAVRTSRNSLRPWEMVAIVSGFPGMVAALKFEWALTNPHLSLHIPSTSRLSVATQRKKNGQPRRPRASLTSILSNLHLLLRVPSFARWPLKLHFFAKDVHTSWAKCCSSSTEPMRDNMDTVTDFGPGSSDATGHVTAALGEAGEASSSAIPSAAWGVHALPLDYTPMKEYVAKGHNVFSFEREGDCVICGDHLAPNGGLHVICSNDGCEAVGHLDCWSRHMLQGQDEETLLPMTGSCPKCGGEVRWEDMMKELTLRVRGQKDVEKLLKTKKRTKAKTSDKAKPKSKAKAKA